MSLLFMSLHVLLCSVKYIALCVSPSHIYLFLATFVQMLHLYLIYLYRLIKKAPAICKFHCSRLQLTACLFLSCPQFEHLLKVFAYKFLLSYITVPCRRQTESSSSQLGDDGLGDDKHFISTISVLRFQYGAVCLTLPFVFLHTLGCIILKLARLAGMI